MWAATCSYCLQSSGCRTIALFVLDAFSCRTLEISCEAPILPGFVSFNSLFGVPVDLRAPFILSGVPASLYLYNRALGDSQDYRANAAWYCQVESCWHMFVCALYVASLINSSCGCFSISDFHAAQGRVAWILRLDSHNVPPGVTTE